MSQLIGPRNLLMYALFHQRGGVRTHLIFSALAGVGAMVLVLLTVTTNRGNSQAAWAGWGQGLLIIQSLGLAILGVTGVSGVVRADIVSGMQENLRLMRAGPAEVIMGYVFGGASQAWAVFFPLMAVGTMCSVLGGVGAVP